MRPFSSAAGGCRQSVDRRLLVRCLVLRGVLLSLLLWVPRVHAGDPSLRWQTLETEHFRIHFYQGQEALARGLALRAERAHRRLAPLLGHTPSRPTHVVLTDDVDAANGSATVIPYNLIRLYATPPPDGEIELNDVDDWMNILITHEYSHILHMDNVSGLPVLINAVVGLGTGKVYAPNQIQPRWFLEGLATYEESARTSAGRIRSRVFDMWLRMAVLENRFQSIDKVSSGTLAFPHGSTAYLYGAFFLKYIADRYGEGVLARVSASYGKGPVPFGLNRTIAEQTGRDYGELWSEFHTSLHHRYEVQRTEIEARGRTVERVLTRHHENTTFPYAWPASGVGARGNDVMYLRDDGYSRPALMLVSADGKTAPRELYRMEAGGRAAPAPGGRFAIASEPDFCRTYYAFNDLFLLDLETGRRRRLTQCARAFDPDVSPDGSQVAFVANEPGGMGTSLRLLALARPDAIRTLVPTEGGRRRAYTPVWSPDGRTIAYSEWSEGGYRDIALVDVQSGRSFRVTHDRAIDLTPRYSPDGRYLLFSSDRTGVYNVFAHEIATGKLWQVTNVLGGAFQPVVAGDGRTLVYQGFSSLGYDLHATGYDPASWKEALPYVSERLDEGAALLEEEAPQVPMRLTSYSAWTTAHPWRIANLSFNPGPFAQLLALDLSGTDAVSIHAWQLHLEQGLGGRGETNVGLTYTWDRLWAPLQGSFSHRTTRAGGYRIDGVERAYAEEQWNGQVLAILPVVRHAARSATVTVNYHYNHFGAADALELPLDPNRAVPSIPEHGALAGVGAGFSFSNVRRYGFSVTPEEGRSIGLNLNLNHEGLGGDFHSVDASWIWTEFLRMPFRRHVLMLNYAGGIGTADLERRGLFFLGGFSENAAYATLLLCALRVKGQADCASGTPPLRGYPPGAFFGDRFHAFTAEYRFPIAELERGVSTLPLYANRLVGAAYADYGLAYFDSARLADFRLGLGAEVALNLALGYSQGVSFRIGYARGLMTGGENQIYVQLRLAELY